MSGAAPVTASVAGVLAALLLLLFLLLLLSLVAFALAAWLAPAALMRLALWAERRRSGLRLRQAQVEGFAMPYLEGGRGEALLLIHGFAGDKDNFTRVARFLTPHYHVLVPDLPGFGDAGRVPGAAYGMQDQVRRLRAFLAARGITRVHLGGNSMGGFIAAQFAGLHPEQVASVWLLDAAGTAGAYDNALLRHYEATGAMPLLIQDPAAFDDLIARTTYRAPFLPRFMRRQYGLRAARDFDLHTVIMRELHASPLIEAQYARLDTPALIVWGERDEILSPAGAAGFRRIFPHSQLRMMPDVGHLPMAEVPRTSARDYLAWRATLGG
jgi:triacylglycerol lipase